METLLPPNWKTVESSPEWAASDEPTRNRVRRNWMEVALKAQRAGLIDGTPDDLMSEGGKAIGYIPEPSGLLKAGSWVEGKERQVVSGIGQNVGTLLRMPGQAVEMATTPNAQIEAAAQDVGAGPSVQSPGLQKLKTDYVQASNDIADKFTKPAQALTFDNQADNTSLADKVTQGKILEASDQILDIFLQNSPQFAAQVAAVGAGVPPAIILSTMAAMSGSDQYASTKGNPAMTEGGRKVNAVVNGLAEALGEKMGSLPWMKGLFDEKQIKELAKMTVIRRGMDMARTSAAEGLSEGGTQLAQNAADVTTGNRTPGMSVGEQLVSAVPEAAAGGASLGRFARTLQGPAITAAGKQIKKDEDIGMAVAMHPEEYGITDQSSLDRVAAQHGLGQDFKNTILRSLQNQRQQKETQERQTKEQEQAQRLKEFAAKGQALNEEYQKQEQSRLVFGALPKPQAQEGAYPNIQSTLEEELASTLNRYGQMQMHRDINNRPAPTAPVDYQKIRERLLSEGVPLKVILNLPESALLAYQENRASIQKLYKIAENTRGFKIGGHPNAVQELIPAQMDVRNTPGNGEGMGEGNAVRQAPEVLPPEPGVAEPPPETNVAPAQNAQPEQPVAPAKPAPPTPEEEERAVNSNLAALDRVNPGDRIPGPNGMYTVKTFYSEGDKAFDVAKPNRDWGWIDRAGAYHAQSPTPPPAKPVKSVQPDLLDMGQAPTARQETPSFPDNPNGLQDDIWKETDPESMGRQAYHEQSPEDRRLFVKKLASSPQTEDSLAFLRGWKEELNKARKSSTKTQAPAPAPSQPVQAETPPPAVPQKTTQPELMPATAVPMQRAPPAPAEARDSIIDTLKARIKFTSDLGNKPYYNENVPSRFRSTNPDAMSWDEALQFLRSQGLAKDSDVSLDDLGRILQNKTAPTMEPNWAAIDKQTKETRARGELTPEEKAQGFTSVDEVIAAEQQQMAEQGEPPDAAPFSVRKTALPEGQTPLTRKHAEAQVAKTFPELHSQGMFEFHDKADTLPPEVLAQAKEMGHRPGNIEGVTHGGKIHLVHGNILSTPRLMQVAAHETIGHHGLVVALGPKRFDKVIKQLSAGRVGAKMQEIAQKHGLDLRDPVGMEETIARFAEMEQLDPAMWKRITAVIRQAFRDMGINVTWSDDDIRTLLRRASKAAQKGKRTGTDTRFSVTPRPDALGFYSAVENTVANAKQEKAPGAQWAAWLKGQPGIKQGELDWLGLPQWLSEQTGAVTKQEVLDFIKANQVEVREVVKGDLDAVAMKRYGKPYDRLSPSDREIIDGGSNDTKFKERQLPGGKNYRELLLTLPEERSTTAFGRFIQDMNAKYGRDYPANMTDAESDKMNRLRTTPDEGDRSTFRSSHFDEPNILAHVRFNERTDADGKRVLFIEEVQSDWHQKGRDEGYQGGTIGNLADMRTRRGTKAEGENNWFAGTSPQDERWGATEYEARQNWIKAKKEAGVPDAPFKTTWPMLAMKRMIRYAAENGFDKIAWTTGEQQAERYNLSKRVSAIDYFNVDGKGGLWSLTLNPLGRGEANMLRVKDGDLENTVGKEIAEKIRSGHGEVNLESGNKILKGVDLKVGGEGMKGFYDAILPAEVNKYVKKWGGRSGQEQIPEDPKAFIGDFFHQYGEAPKQFTVHSLDITPAMRDAVMQGQARFSTKRPSLQVAKDKLAELAHMPIGENAKSTEDIVSKAYRAGSLESVVDKVIKDRVRDEAGNDVEWLIAADKRLAFLAQRLDQLSKLPDKGRAWVVFQSEARGIFGAEKANRIIAAARAASVNKTFDPMRTAEAATAFMQQEVADRVFNRYASRIKDIHDRYAPPKPNKLERKIIRHEKALDRDVAPRTSKLLDTLAGEHKKEMETWLKSYPDLRDLSSDDIRSKYEEATRIIHESNQEKKLIGEGRKQEASGLGAHLSSLVQGILKKLPLEKKGNVPNNRGIWMKLANDAYANQETAMLTVFGNDPQARKLMYDDPRKGDNKAKKAYWNARKSLDKFMKSLKITEDKHFEMRTRRRPWKVGNRMVDMTDAERINFAALWQRDEARMKLLRNGWRIGRFSDTHKDEFTFKTIDAAEAAAQDILKTITGKERELANTMIKIMTDMGTEGNKVSRELYGYDLFVEPRYFGIQAESERAHVAEDLIMATGMSFVRHLEGSGFTKKPITHNNPLKISDAFTIFDDHIHDMSKYIGLTIPIRNLLTTLSVEHGDLRKTLNEHMGRGFVRNLELRLTSLAGLDRRDYEGVAVAVNWLTSNVAKSTLGFSPSTYTTCRYGGKALYASELLRMHPELVPAFMAKTKTLFTENGRDLVKFMMEESPYLEDRWSSDLVHIYFPVLQEKEIAEGKLKKTRTELRKWQQIGLSQMKFAEQVNALELLATLTENGKMSRAKAIEVIEELTRSTQNASTALEESPFQMKLRRSGFGFLAPFMSQVIANRNLLLRDWLRKDWPAFMYSLCGFLINIAIAGAVGAGRQWLTGSKHSDDKILMNAATNALRDVTTGFVPGSGMAVDKLIDVANGTLNRGSSSMIERPAQIFFEKTAKGVKQIKYRVEEGEWKEGAWKPTPRTVIDLANVVPAYLGAPTGGPVFVAKLVAKRFEEDEEPKSKHRAKGAGF